MKRHTSREELREWFETRDERMKKWTREHAIRYKKAFNDQIVNWTKTNCRPITPLYKQQCDEQYYLLSKIGNLWHEWSGTRHTWDENEDERRQRIIENEKAYVKSKEQKIRIVVRDPNKVTQGHTPNRHRGKKGKRIRRDFCD